MVRKGAIVIYIWSFHENFENYTCVSPVLTQNQGIWNLYGSLTFNNGN